MMDKSNSELVEELALTKKLLFAAYEREVFYKEDRDKHIENAEKWKAECRHVAIACGWSRDEYEMYLKEKATLSGD